MTEVELYADGACLGNPGPGGWGFLLRLRTDGGPKEKEGSGAEPDTTNNRMELSAVIRGLETLTRPCTVELWSDSQYVVKGIAEWLPGWKRKQWRKADGHPVMNADLWQALDAQLKIHRVKAHWVKGHAGHPENERVDRLATDAAKSLAKV
ncbi:MAG TPA: ribonuclease HI [Holophagaceae bacterium]|nr:ribonuclease HI [Holophagaceae bacterium]